MEDLQLASASDVIKIWDCNGYIFHKQFTPHSHSVYSLTWAHDNSIIASASTGCDKVVLTYPESPAYTYSIGEKLDIGCVAFNSASRYVLGGSKNGDVHVWDLKTKSLKRSYSGHKKSVTAVQFNWNDTMIASSSESGEIILFNVVSGIASNPLIYKNSLQAVRKIQYSHFKKSLIGSCSDSGAVCLWDTNKRQLVNSFTSHTAPVMGLAFSPLNEMLLMSVGLDKRIVCYDVHGKKPVRTMEAEGSLTSIDIKHDGATLAVGSTKGKIFMYDLRKGSEPIKVVTAHTSAVRCLSFQYRIQKDESGKSVTKSAAGLHKNSSSSSLKVNQAAAEKPNGTPEMNVPRFNNNKEKLNERRPSLDSIKKEANDYHFNEHRPSLDSIKKEDNDLFSPIREVSTPKSSDLSTSAETNNKSNCGGLSDALFSPLENDGHQLSSSSVRGQPVGGLEIFSSFVTPKSAKTSTTFLTEHVDVERSRTSPHPSPTSVSSLSTDIKAATGTSPRASQALVTSADVKPPQSLLVTSSHVSPATVSKQQHQLKQPSLEAAVVSMVTPPDAAPSGAAAEEGAVGGQQPFQAQFIRGMIEDALEDFRDQVRQDILNLHMEVIKQFQSHQDETRQLLQQYSVNEQLLQEVERLREENDRLKRTY